MHVKRSSDTIIAKQTSTPSMGTRGTNGVRYGRGALGFVFRMMMMPMHTITNANSVPILVISPSLEIVRKPENSETNTMKARLQRYGVWNFGWISEKSPGSRPSRDIE